MAETTSRGKVSIGARGITPLPPGAPKLSVPYNHPGKEKCTAIHVDSFPSDDGWWTPPVHGEDVECLWNNSELEELEELRLQDPKRFLTFLEAHGCNIRDQDFLSCFDSEEGLQPFHKRRDKRHAAGFFGVEPPGPDHDDYELLTKTHLKNFFNLDWKWGHVVYRPRSPEAKVLERHLNAIPENLGILKRQFKARNEEAGDAVRCSDWKTACQYYEECLRILVSMEKGLWTRLQTWLLLWVCIPLVHMYQFWLKNYPKCIAIYDRMLQQLNQEDTDGSEDDGSLGQLYYVIVWHRRLVLFEWSHTLDHTKAEGDQRRHRLLSLYVRSKAFNVVAVQNKEAQGFEWLQKMTNKWGRQSNMKSEEGDMRIAFCFNLQHLFGISQQLSAELVKWTREKWVWINPIDVAQELKILWKIQDIEAFDLSNMADKGQDDIELLRKEIAQLEGCNELQLKKKILKCSIDRIEAKSCMDSDPRRAKQLLRKAENELSKLGSSTVVATELVELKFVRAKILHDRISGSQVLKDSPFGVLQPTFLNKKVVKRAEEATKLFEAEDSSRCLSKQPGSPSALNLSRVERLRGCQLLWDLYVHKERRNGPISNTYVRDISEKYDEVMDAFKMSLHLLSRTVYTLQPTRTDEIDCHIELGNCYINAVGFKDPDLKICNDAEEGLHVHRDCHLNTAIEHFQQALILATTSGPDSRRLRISKCLGSAHYEKAVHMYDRLQEFFLLIPGFLKALDEAPQSNKSKIRLELERKCASSRHSHLHSLTVEQGGVYYAVDQGIAEGLKLNREWTKGVPMCRLVQSGPSRVDLSWLIDEFLLRFVEDFWMEIQQSINHLLESLKMDFAIPFGAPQDGHSFTFNEVVWSRAESSKIVNTKLQFLICIGFSAGDIRQVIDIRRALTAVPKRFKKTLGPADYERMVNELKCQRRQGLYPEGLDVRKGLLWAERGRSRILINQFVVANKLHQDATEINKLVNFNFTDKKSWKILRAAQLACGDNTVFVEYIYDTYMGGGYIDQVFVYVISKEGEVVVRDIEIGDPQDLQDSLKRVHEYMSNPVSSQAETNQTDLEKLYDIFIRPISDLLDGMEPEDKLVFALDDVLTNVPFSILLNVTTGKYLIESHTISFTPALRVLALCNERFKSMGQASQRIGPSVALGDPAYRAVRKRLVHTLKEVTKIPDFFKDGCVKVMTGPDASINNLLKFANLPADTVQGFVHVAAHGIVDSDNRSGSLSLAEWDKKYKDPPPLKFNTYSDSSLGGSSHQRDEDVLENDELEEVTFDDAHHKFEMLGVGCVRGGSTSRKSGILRSENIVKAGFEWRSRLVVLSACNTAKGCVLKTEGVVGLPRAFLVAGVPCVVASQWSLDDEASSELMQKFYQEMSRGSDTATAMRAAMLRMKPKQGSSSEIASSVYKWGGYLVWGLPTVALPTCMLKTPCLPPKPISIHGSEKKTSYYPGKLIKELWANDLIEKWIFALFLLAVVTGKWTSAVLFQALLANTLFLQMLMFSIYLITEKVILKST